MKKKINKSSAKRLIVILSLSLAILIAAGAFSYAWIRNYMDAGNVSVETGKMLYKVTAYKVSNGVVSSTVLFDTDDPVDAKRAEENTSLQKPIILDKSLIKVDVEAEEEIFFIIEKYAGSIDFDVALSFDNDGLNGGTEKDFEYVGQLNYALEDDSDAVVNADNADDIQSYLATHAENDGKVENLGTIWNTMEKTSLSGEQKYASIRLKIGKNIGALSADSENNKFPFKVELCVAQKGALPSDLKTDTFYADDLNTFKQALQEYGSGDEIYVTQDIEYIGDLVFTRPCKLVLIRSTLTVKGNLIYSYMYGGKFTINTVSDGHIKIEKNDINEGEASGGNFQIDLPDTTIEIEGANNAAEGKADIYVEGRFTANASKAEGEGILFKGARICDKGSTNLKPVLINGSSRIYVSNRTRIGALTANFYCRKLILENNGYIENVDLCAMEQDVTLLSSPCILIDNAGMLGNDIIKLPKWSKKFIDSEKDNLSPNDNTQIISNKGSSTIRAVADGHDIGDPIEVVNAGDYFYSNGNKGGDGFRDDIEYMLREQFVEAVNGDKSNIIIHYEAPSPIVLRDYPELSELGNLQSFVEFYAKNGEINAANALTKVTIICYGNQTLSTTDYSFIKTMTALTELDLSDAESFNKAVPNNAFKGMTALTKVTMSESDTQWGQNIFTGTGVDEITFPQSLTKLDNPKVGNTITGERVLDGIKYVRTSISLVSGLHQNSSNGQYFFTPDSYTRDAYVAYYSNGGADWRAKFFIDNGAIRYGEFFLRYDPNASDAERFCEVVAFTGGYVLDANNSKTFIAWTDDAYQDYQFDFNRIEIDNKLYTITSYDPYALYDKLKSENAFNLVLESNVAYIGEYAFASSNNTNSSLGLVSVDIKGNPQIMGYAFAYNDVLETFRAENLTTLKGGYNLSNNDSLEKVYMPKLSVVEGGGDISTCKALKDVDIGVIEKTETNKTFYTSNDSYSYARFYIHTENAGVSSTYTSALAADYRHIFVKKSYADLYKVTSTYTGLTEMGENSLDSLIAADVNGNSLEDGEELAYYYVLDGNNAHLVACLLKTIDKTGEDYTTIEKLGGYPVTYIGSAAYHFTSMKAQNITIPDGIDKIGDYSFDSNKFKKYCITLDLSDIEIAGKSAFYYMDMVRVVGDKLEEVGKDTFSYNQNLVVANLPNLSRSRPASSSDTPQTVFVRCTSLRIAYIGWSENISYDDAYSRAKNYIRFMNFVSGDAVISPPSVNTVVNSGAPKVKTNFYNNFANSDTSFSNIYFSNYYDYPIKIDDMTATIRLPGYIYLDKGNSEVELFAVSPDIERFWNYKIDENGERNYYSPGALYADEAGYTTENNGTDPVFTVTSLGNHAYGAVSISRVDNFIIADSVTTINNRALKGSAYWSSSTIITTLQDVKCLDLANATFLGDNACAESSIKQVKAKNLQTVGGNAFSECRSLEEIYLPALTSITSSGAFRYCTSLTEVTFGEGLKKIPNDTFNNCSALKKLTLLNSEDVVTVGADNSSSSLTSAEIAANVIVRVPASVYDQYKGKYTSNNGFGRIPLENFEKFGMAVEDGEINYYLNVISETDKTAYIDYFNGELPTNVTFPDTLNGYKIVSVSATAMSALVDVESVTLPKYMEYLNFTTADISDTVKTLVIDSSNTKFMTVDGVLYTKDGKTLLVYPMAKSGTSFAVGSGVTEIAYRAFYGAKNLQTVEFASNAVVTIRDNAFEKCTVLKTIKFNNSTESTFAGNNILLGANVNLKIDVPDAAISKYKAKVLIDYSILDRFI